MDQSTPRHPQHIPLAVCYVLLAALTMTLMSLLVKLIGDRASTVVIIFARFTVSLVLLLPWVFRRPVEVVEVVAPMKVVTRSFFSLISMGCFYYALRSISLTNALLLSNTTPLFVPLVTAVMIQTKTPYKLWIGILIGFIGVAFILKPEAHFWESGSFVGLGSGIFGAIAVVIIRMLTKSVSILQILFYNFLIGSVVTGVLLPWSWTPLNAEIIFLLLGVGVAGTIYQYFSTMSYAKAPVRLTSPLMFMSVIFGTVADYFIWHHMPDQWDFLGVALVILGGTFTIYYGHREFSTQFKKKP